VTDWAEQADAAAARYRDGEARLGRDDEAADPRQRQLTRLGNAAWAAGLCLLMAGRGDEAAAWLRLAAGRYRESWQEAPLDSWGRPIGATKALLVAGDDAADAARWALDAGAPGAASPIGRYAGTLALLVLGRDDEAAALAATLESRDDFPPDVAAALAGLATCDGEAYAGAVAEVLRSFEARDAFLEDVAVADTVIVLQRLAGARGLAAALPPSVRLPA
jgi:hypothetical protein